VFTGPPTHSVGGQSSNGRSVVGVCHRRLSPVTLPAGRARGLSGGRHCTAWPCSTWQYGYVSLGRHLVTYELFVTSTMLHRNSRTSQSYRQSTYTV